jgi:tetratricopeptide (TPR) repeat protein
VKKNDCDVKSRCGRVSHPPVKTQRLGDRLGFNECPVSKPVISAAAFFVVAIIATALSQNSETSEAMRYQQQVSKGYQFVFGPNPFLPSHALTSTGGFLPAEAFPRASYCAKCHEDAHREWRQSAHANSFRAPFYLRNVQLLIDQKGIEYTRHCEGCHNPIALLSGALTKDSPLDRSFDEDGVTCMVCHSIAKIQDTAGTGSYVMGVPAVMVSGDGTPLPGEASFDDILAHPKLHSQAVMKDFYRTPEFCAVCHKAALPKMLNGYKWQRAFSVYDEWQQSSWSQESPLPFYKKESVSACQTCHMPPSDSTRDYAAKGGKIKSHRFLGANTAIPSYYGYHEQLNNVQEFLKDTLAIDIFGLQTESGRKTQMIAPLGSTAFRLQSGEPLTVCVVIQNKKIGHSLVPEQRDFYESWVEFEARDGRGKVLYHSGYLKPNGYLEEHAHSYTNRLVSITGKLNDLHQVWATKVKAYDNTILPGRSDLVRYRFWIPGDAPGPITLTAKVNYRRFRRGFTDFVFQAPREFPIVEIATKSASLQLGLNKASAEIDAKTEMFRWNNYGIALMGEQQYWEAEQAFRQVVAIDPGYADGYVNISLAEYSKLIENKREAPDGVGNMSVANTNYEKFEPALQALARALVLKPDDPRVRYYRGVIYRLQNNLALAAEDQQYVLSLFPRFRQARQELGYIYYLQKKYESAEEQFEALQVINPDDLTAHYYLSLICDQLGMKERGQQEGAEYSEHRDDPTAGRLAQDFWRTNPAVAEELAPYHVHGAALHKETHTTVGGPLP